jgi:hypothetical protein
MDTHKELVRCDDARNNVPGKIIIVSLFIIIAVAGWRYSGEEERKVTHISGC